MTAVPCPFCGAEHTAGTFVCPTTNRRLQGLLPVDTIIDEKYRIDGIIGVGGMGVVYRAEQTKIRRQVALKMLLPEYIVYPDLVARVEREAATAGQINHPNVVSIVDLGVTPDQGPYIAMELLHGQELATTVERAGGRLEPGDAVDILRSVLGGLEAAHKKGVIHRDLKPENIFLTEDDDKTRGVKVLDFGISKLRDDSQLNSLTRTGTVMGTPQFMAPEQAAGARDQDARIDLYAAGAVLYAVLCNGLPYEAENYNLLISEILNKPPIQILTRSPALDPRLATIVMKAIAKRPDPHVQSARAMSDALGAWYEIRNTPRPTRTSPAGRDNRLGSADSTAPIELRRGGAASRSAVTAPAMLIHPDDTLSPDDPLYFDRNEATLVVSVPLIDGMDDDDSSPRYGHPGSETPSAPPMSFGVPRSPPPPPPSNPPGPSGMGLSGPSLPSILLESPLDAPPIVLPSEPKPPPTDEAWARLRTAGTSSKYPALVLEDLAHRVSPWRLRVLLLALGVAIAMAVGRWYQLRHRINADGSGGSSLVPAMPYHTPIPIVPSLGGASSVRPAVVNPGAQGGTAGDSDPVHHHHHHHDPAPF